MGREGVYCSSISITPHFHRLFVLAFSLLLCLSMLDLSSSSHNKVCLYLIDKAHVPLTDTTAGPCQALRRDAAGACRGGHMVPISRQKSQLRPESQRQKGRFTLIARIQERVIKKPVRKKQVHLLSPLPYRMVNIFDKTSHLRLRRYICHGLQYSFRIFQSKVPSLLLLSPSCPQLTRHSTLATLAALWFLGPAKHTPSSELCTSCPLSGTL